MKCTPMRVYAVVFYVLFRPSLKGESVPQAESGRMNELEPASPHLTSRRQRS